MNVFLDANLIIYWLEGDAALASRAHRAIAETMTSPNAQLCVSALSLMECRVRPLRLAQHDILARYDDFFASHDLHIVALDASVMAIASSLRAHYGLKTPDALQAASCLSLAGKTVFLTGDRGFLRVPGLTVNLFDST